MKALLLRYAVWFAAGWMALSGGLYIGKTSGRPDPAGTLVQKMKAYSADPSRYDLVFLGDSRTYCAMHPDRLDPLLGIRSINLAHWAHWFPTQYAQFLDLTADLPAGTVVVWSIGHQNFRPVHPQVHASYPVGLFRLPRYVKMGYPPGRFRENLLFFQPATTILGWMPQLRQRLDSTLEKPVLGAGRAGGGGGRSPELRARIAALRSAPLTAKLEILTEDRKVTSLAVTKTNGAYERIEIDHAFFRRKQEENAAEIRSKRRSGPESTDPAPEYWNTFLAILDLCRDRGVDLIVNEIEEAPYVYLDPGRKERWRRFMRETVAPEVRRRGFPYVRVDFDRLTDEDYFDFNHLNHRGILAYSPLLAEQLKPLLSSSPLNPGGAM